MLILCLDVASSAKIQLFVDFPRNAVSKVRWIPAVIAVHSILNTNPQVSFDIAFENTHTHIHAYTHGKFHCHFFKKDRRMSFALSGNKISFLNI